MRNTTLKKQIQCVRVANIGLFFIFIFILFIVRV